MQFREVFLLSRGSLEWWFEVTSLGFLSDVSVCVLGC